MPSYSGVVALGRQTCRVCAVQWGAAGTPSVAANGPVLPGGAWHRPWRAARCAACPDQLCVSDDLRGALTFAQVEEEVDGVGAGMCANEGRGISLNKGVGGRGGGGGGGGPNGAICHGPHI